MSKYAVEDFLKKENIFAVVGATDNKDKYGYKVFKKLIDLGYESYPVNPNKENILGRKVYPKLKDVPENPDVVSIITPPKVTTEIVKECKELKIDKVWMQPGAESKEAVEFCNQNEINLLHNRCIMIETYQ